MTKEKFFDDELLSDEQLDNVNGGLLTAYIFLISHERGGVKYLTDPIAIGALTWDDRNFYADNFNLIIDILKRQPFSFAANDQPIKDFAKKRASHWTDPGTYGNLVFALDINTHTITRYEA